MELSEAAVIVSTWIASGCVVLNTTLVAISIQAAQILIISVFPF